ncbi:uncharacterized protein LOC117120271, partial [Anneissia japonica]|uniref:uncharacterized protein LOC117120271 n=1 Tax=Anneissia japonica TaxID=1529436 RepID=UPI00142580F7
MITIVIDNKPSLKLKISRVAELKEDGREMPTGELSPNVCMQVLEFLKKELIVLTSGMKHAGYTLCVMCWAGFQDMHFHKLEDCLKNDFIRCGENLVNTSKLQRKFKDPTESASSNNKEEAP